MEIRFRYSLPPNRGGGPFLKGLIEFLAAQWVPIYRAAPLPPLYQGTVVYRPEPNRGLWEDFASPAEVFERGWGDCDDLAIARIVELLAHGIPASCQFVRKIGTTRMHVRVRNNGRVEDPCLILQALEKKRNGQ
jgi:hypothetical protein